MPCEINVLLRDFGPSCDQSPQMPYQNMVGTWDWWRIVQHALSHISKSNATCGFVETTSPIDLQTCIKSEFSCCCPQHQQPKFPSSNKINSLLLIGNHFDAHGDVEHAKPSFVVLLPLQFVWFAIYHVVVIITFDEISLCL
jgi:hypothetical protein